MTPNTSWEHHPYSGPVVVLHGAHTPVGYLVGGAMLIVLSAGICLPAFRPSILTVIIAFMSGAAWVGISYMAAMIASV